VPARLQETSSTADESSQGLLDEAVPALAEACYTEADRSQAKREGGQGSGSSDG